MSVEPLDNNVLVEIFDSEKSFGLIIIPSSYSVKKSSGTVISVGENVRDKRITSGSIVYTVKGAGKETEFEENGKKFLLIKDYDLLAFTEN